MAFLWEERSPFLVAVLRSHCASREYHTQGLWSICFKCLKTKCDQRGKSIGAQDTIHNSIQPNSTIVKPVSLWQKDCNLDH